jgi:hypothetical protein
MLVPGAMLPLAAWSAITVALLVAIPVPEISLAHDELFVRSKNIGNSQLATRTRTIQAPPLVPARMHDAIATCQEREF